MKALIGRSLALLCAGALLLAGSVEAADPPLELKWSQLVPPRAPGAPKLKPFFSGMPDPSDDAPAPPPMPEGKFMSMKRRQPGAGQPPAVVSAFNDKRVAIGGYVVPLDLDALQIKEFLLVPFVGACIHVPPPPANQIIYVTAADGFEISGPFDPVKVTGKMSTEPAITGVADAGYRIEADQVDRLTP